MADLPWREVTELPPDGWYWWRPGNVNEHPHECDLVKVFNGKITPHRSKHGFCETMDEYQHQDFWGLWAGPIVPPSVKT